MRRAWRPSRFLLGSIGCHAASAVALAAAPATWPVVASVLVVNHAVIAGASVWPRSRLLGPNLSRLPEAAARRGQVALTFDDGPDPEVTPRVLDRLDAAGARATFFCIGRRVLDHPDLAAEIVRRGHRLENHTHTHPHSFSLYSSARVRREIADAQEAIESAAGRAPRLFRAPAGIRGILLDRELGRAGLALASWTRRGYDTVSREPRRVARRLLRDLAAGDVLLLHDGSVARDRHGVPVVLEALPRVLDALAARGLSAVTLDAATEESAA